MKKKYVIICKNNGMWGGMESVLKNNGVEIIFESKEEAQKKVKEIEERQSRVNNFNSYFVEELD